MKKNILVCISWSVSRGEPFGGGRPSAETRRLHLRLDPLRGTHFQEPGSALVQFEFQNPHAHFNRIRW